MQQDTPRQTTGSHDTGAPARDRPEHHPGNWHRDVRPSMQPVVFPDSGELRDVWYCSTTTVARVTWT